VFKNDTRLKNLICDLFIIKRSLIYFLFLPSRWKRVRLWTQCDWKSAL